MSGRGLPLRFVFVLLVPVSGCGGEQASTAPAPTVAPINNPTPAFPTRAIQSLRIAGRVLDTTDRPVPSARVPDAELPSQDRLDLSSQLSDGSPFQ
jgi:hypothetical protein